jgi:hypothetical protein
MTDSHSRSSKQEHPHEASYQSQPSCARRSSSPLCQFPGQYTVQSLQLNQNNSGDYPLEYDWNRDGIPDFLASADTNQNLISNSKTGAYTYQKAPGSLEGAIKSCACPRATVPLVA